jgi:hypothetical protein
MTTAPVVSSGAGCLRPREDIRRAWRDAHGLPLLAGELFDASIDAVWHRMGAHIDGDHVGSNAVLKKASSTLAT